MSSECFDEQNNSNFAGNTKQLQLNEWRIFILLI